MAVWNLAGDSGLKTLFSSLPAALFQKERWFADRGLQNEISLVDSAQFLRTGPAESALTLNLYQTQPFCGCFYYLPFLITKSRDRDDNTFFEKNGYCFYDAIPTNEYISLVEELIQNRAIIPTSEGSFHFKPYRNLNEPRFCLQGGTSNSLLFVTRSYLLKNYRRIYPGINPELKVSAALTKIGSKQIPEIYSFFNYQSQSEYTLGVIMEAVENSGSGWERWGRFLYSLSPENEKVLCQEANQLGKALAILHRDLSIIAGEGREYGSFNQDDLEKRVANIINNLQEDLEGQSQIVSINSKLTEVKKSLSQRNLGGKFRIHGDLHLEQIIKTTDGWRILDFEGEPLKSISERENYDSPLKDLASMLRSISYRFNGGVTNFQEIEEKVSTNLIEGYFRSYREINADFLPEREEFRSLLTLFQIERAVYECLYESKYRPDWLWIPQTGLARLIQSL